MKVSGWYAVGFYGVIAVVIFFFGWKCGSGNAKKVSHAVTIRDTIITPGQLVIDTAYVPKPVKVVVRDTIGYYDTTMFISPGPANEINRIVHRSIYSDTVKISHGSVTITDTIADNRITGRSVKADIDVPTVTKTVTLTQPKRAIAYFGLQVQGGPQNYLFSLGADLSLKTKNDRIYSAGVSLTRDNQVLYGMGVRFPIRLRK